MRVELYSRDPLFHHCFEDARATGDEFVYVKDSGAIVARSLERALLVLDARELTDGEIRSFVDEPHTAKTAILVVVASPEGITDLPNRCDVLDFLVWPCPPQVIAARLGCFRSHFRSPDAWESTSMFRELADTVPLLIWQSRADGVATYYNERWYAYTGMTRNMSPPADTFQFVHPDDRQEAAECLRTGKIYRGEIRLREVSGRYKWHHHLTVPIRDEKGKIKKWIGSAIDIDARKRNAEESKRLYRELERKREIKDDFLKTLSHELRTPLNIIVGYGNLLAETCPLPEEDAESVETILRQAHHILSMVEELPWRALSEQS